MLKDYSKFWKEIFSEKYFEKAGAASINFFRNERKVRLSEIDINKRNFNYWKNQELFTDLDFAKKKGWSLFNGVDELALLVVGELWKFGFGIEHIKPILKFFYTDSLTKNDIEVYLKKNKTIDIETIFNPEFPDLLSFFFQERKTVKYFINNLEFLMLLISRTNKNILFLFDGNENVKLLIDDEHINIIGEKPMNDFFYGTLLTLSLSKFHRNIYMQQMVLDDSPLPNLFKNAHLKQDKEYKSEQLKTDININSALKEYPNQDIVIEIRNKQKTKITRTIINSKKV